MDLFEAPSLKSRTDSSLDSSQASTIALYTDFNAVFESEDFSDLNVLLPITDFESKKKYFIKLDLNDKLEDALRNKTLLEYPTLYIVRTKDLGGYTIQQDVKSISKNLTKEINTTNSNEIDTKKEINKVRRTSGNLEDGECDSSLSDEFQESDEDEKMIKRSMINDDEEIISNKKLKIGDDINDCQKSVSEDGELDDSN